MNREEILEKSREENKNGDERDLRARDRSYAISASVGLLLCLLIVFAEEILFERSAIQIWVVYTGIEFTTALAGFIQTKKRWLLFLAVFMGLIFAAMVAVYIVGAIG